MMMIKGKRTKRPRPSDLESARAATSSSTTTTNTASEEDDQDMAAHCLILLAQGGTKFPKPTQEPPKPVITTITSAGAAYECKTCNRCFPSFQALGGHRASHNKPRLPPPEKAVAVAVAVAPSPSFTVDGDHQEDYFISKGAIKEAEMMGLSLQMACGYNSSNTLSASNTKPKVHACSICGAEFSSGQALGGHMRRHRPLPSASAGSPPEQTTAPPRNQLCLDLNLPADEQEEVTQSPKFTFGSNDKTLVFAASLVDCRY